MSVFLYLFAPFTFLDFVSHFVFVSLAVRFSPRGTRGHGDVLQLLCFYPFNLVIST